MDHSQRSQPALFFFTHTLHAGASACSKREARFAVLAALDMFGCELLIVTILMNSLLIHY